MEKTAGAEAEAELVRAAEESLERGAVLMVGGLARTNAGGGRRRERRDQGGGAAAGGGGGANGPRPRLVIPCREV
jgi:hypothetical protein